MKNALLSVYNKQGVDEFARQLIALDFKIYASGGTARHLRAAGVNVTDISTLVGGGPMLGHRVVTLSREIHAGLLARLDSFDDMSEVAKQNIPLIHLVCVDLYPLEAEMRREGSTIESIIEMTDIGGPALLRSAAKGRRIVIADRSDWAEVLSRLEHFKGDLPLEYRDRLAARAEYVVAEYCLASAKARGGDLYAGLSIC